MDSVTSKAFFSRPFDDRISETISLIEAICRGMDVQTVCVDSPSAAVPSAEANSLIAKSDFLIAMCTKVHKIEGKDQYLTSTAVREEIAAAQALGKKVIFFFEKDVNPDGFAYNRATSHVIENAKKLSHIEIEKITKGIHQTKLATIEKGNDIFYATGVKNFHISHCRVRYELKKTQKGLLWEYTIEKNIVFEDDHHLPITSSAYCLQNVPECINPPNFTTNFIRNGKIEHPQTEIVSEKGFVRISSTFDPLPKQGDVVLLREKFQSPFLAPIYSGYPNNAIKVLGKTYNAYDGVGIIHRTHLLDFELIIPEEVGFTDISPMVGTFSNELDYINEEEIGKINDSNWFTTENFGGSQTVRLRVDRPLYQYFYGIAWNVVSASDEALPIAPETSEWL